MSARTRYRALVNRAVTLAAERLGTQVICDRCGATIDTFADACSAPLDDPCPGFKRYDVARRQALIDVGALRPVGP